MAELEIFSTPDEIKALFTPIEKEAHATVREILWVVASDFEGKPDDDSKSDLWAACVMDALRRRGFKVTRDD